MNVVDIKLPTEAGDLYPSRGGREVEFLDRKDPVVYATDDQPCPIDQAQIEKYKETGFLILDSVFNEEEIASFSQELERLNNNAEVKALEEAITEPDSGDVRSIFRVHEISPVFKKLSQDNYLVKLAQYLLNDEVYIHQSRLNYKPGFRGKEFYWHSDFETWHVEDGMPRMRALSMSITLTENYIHNGSLMLIPGSHKQYVTCEGETPADHFKSSLKKQEYGVPSDESLQQLVEKGGIVTAAIKPGSVIIFDCNAMHGSNGNITPFPRSNVFFVYNALSNKVGRPFCDRPPRPEFICSRQNIRPVEPDESNADSV